MCIRDRLLIARPILLAIPVLNRASPTIHIPATIITVELEKPEYTSESFISGKIIHIAREAIIAVMANGIFSKTKEIIVIIVIIIAIVLEGIQTSPFYHPIL